MGRGYFSPDHGSPEEERAEEVKAEDHGGQGRKAEVMGRTIVNVSGANE